MRLVGYTFLLGLSTLLIESVVGQAGCSVSIRNGIVNGAVQDTINPSRKICSFRGIPFASPPVGVLRFSAPQPARPWGTLDATRSPNWCPQTGSPPPGTEMSEDCLYLNVFQPQIPNVANANLPVMVWIHGGSFTSGSASDYSPIRLMARGDIILVVVQYRLGTLGFLSTADEQAPGNWGLKDQSFAIRWVNENIRAFGGNPSNVKIFGESAGAGSVSHQMLSPLNRGLIHGAIAQSGSALAVWALDEDPSTSSKIMGRRLNCSTQTNAQLVACLRTTEWRRLVDEQTKYIAETFHSMNYPFATVTPVVEPNLPGAFISRHPLDIMRSGDVPNIPMMLGANKHDGSFVLGAFYRARLGPLKLDQDGDYLRNQIVPDMLRALKINETANRAVASTFEMAYLSGVDRSNWNASMPGLVDISSVLGFKSSTLNTAELLSRRGNNIYLYSFEHHSLNTVWPMYGVGSAINPGITHADDLIYLFDFPSRFSENDQKFSEIIIDMWLNFGRVGNPTPTPDPRYEDWPEYKSDSEYYMKLNSTPTAMQDFKNSWRPNGFEWN